MPRARGSRESSYALYGGTPRCCSPTFGICRAHQDSRHEVLYEPRSYRRIERIADRRAVDIEGYSLLEVIAWLEAFSSLVLIFPSDTPVILDSHFVCGSETQCDILSSHIIGIFSSACLRGSALQNSAYRYEQLPRYREAESMEQCFMHSLSKECRARRSTTYGLPLLIQRERRSMIH